MKKTLLYFFPFLLLLASCQRDVEPPPDFGYGYFPDEDGHYVIYEVDSIDFDDVQHPPDTTRYLLKEIIASHFTDISGRPTQRIERFFKFYNDTIPYDSMPWLGPKVWFANRTLSTAEKVEENIRYVKLTFPVKKGKTWNGNAFNPFNEKNYEIISLDEPETVGNLFFDSVLTVLQYEDINFILSQTEKEKYAKNIGLLYRQRDSVYTGGTQNKIGYKFSQKIVSYGK